MYQLAIEVALTAVAGSVLLAPFAALGVWFVRSSDRRKAAVQREETEAMLREWLATRK